MSSKLFYDSDDERDSFDVERRQIESFRRNFLSASLESSDDDDEGIIDGSKIPSSTKIKSRARRSFMDISTLSSSSSMQQDDGIDLEQNPFEIISKSIIIESAAPKKKKKSLGVSKSRIVLDTTDIYEREDSNQGADERSDQENIDHEPSKKSKSEKKARIRKPTKAVVLETERKMQQLSRSEHLVLPTFVPKPLDTWRALEKRSRQELMNEIRAKNPSFTPQDPDLPELPAVDIESTAESTLADLTRMIEDKPVPPPTNAMNKLSRFLNPDILKKKPTMANITSDSSHTMIDLCDTRKAAKPPTVKSSVHIALDGTPSPSSNKKLFEMQKQLGIRMRAKRAAMLADNAINVPVEDEEEVEELENDDGESTDTSEDSVSERLSVVEPEQEDLQIDQETRSSRSDDDDDDATDEEEETKENTNPSFDPNRPSLKSILTRMESSSESMQPQPADQTGQTEWFHSSRPAEFDTNIELLCSGAFGGDDAIPLSQNYTRTEPMGFSPLPPTQLDDDDDVVMHDVRRTKVRQLIDDDDGGSGEPSKPTNSGSTVEESDEEEEDDDDEDNEELVDYKKQLFEMEAEESGSENEEKNKDDEESESDDNEEPDEELQKFIDTAAIEMDETELDDMAKVHLKLKAKEDDQQLKLLKEQYLDFDGDDDGRRMKITKARIDDDDDDYRSEIEEEEDDDDEEEEDPLNANDRISELERQRSIQDNQAEELHLDEDLDNIGQHSSMFQKGLALKQKKIQTTSTVTSHAAESTTTTDSVSKKSRPARSVTLSSVLLAQRFSSTLLAPVSKSSVTIANTTTSESTIATKKQHNPRRHVFSTNTANENQNPAPSTISAGEKRSNSTEKSPSTKIKRFKKSTATTTTTISKAKDSSTSVFSALALSNVRR